MALYLEAKKSFPLPRNKLPTGIYRTMTVVGEQAASLVVMGEDSQDNVICALLGHPSFILSLYIWDPASAGSSEGKPSP